MPIKHPYRRTLLPDDPTVPTLTTSQHLTHALGAVKRLLRASGCSHSVQTSDGLLVHETYNSALAFKNYQPRLVWGDRI
jgi:hypothetical protein